MLWHLAWSWQSEESFVTMAEGKIRPRTGHEGPEMEKRYISIISLTSALYEGGS
jgi:hypothetical protein